MAGNTEDQPGDPQFCDNYTEVSNINELIADSKQDFFVRYRIWQERGSPAGPAMLTIFGGPSASEDALKVGNVLEKDCAKFNDFVVNATYSANEVAASQGLEVEDSRGRAALLFESAVLKLFESQEELSVWERGALNGALIVQANLNTTSIGSLPERKIYGIPAFVVLPWIHDATSGTWNEVDRIIEEAFASLGSRLINVSGVVQIRLGDGDQPIFEPLNVAPGFAIRGGV